MTTSSVDPTIEIAAVFARLDALTGKTYEGIPQGTKLDLNGFGAKLGYRDFEPGSVTPGGSGRIVGAGPQSQPHIWAFQVHHFGSTRREATALSIESDLSLIGWSPSTNAGPIAPFFFQVYDNMAKNGERVGWITTRFYETQLGQNPDLT